VVGALQPAARVAVLRLLGLVAEKQQLPAAAAQRQEEAEPRRAVEELAVGVAWMRREGEGAPPARWEDQPG
jgi:hypothetical protein